VVRLVGGYPALMSQDAYGVLETKAGPVHLADYPVNAAVYAFAAAHSSEADSLLELPHGGGITFALHRRNAAYGMLFIQVPHTEEYQALDVRLVQEKPPAVVIADDLPNYGTVYGLQYVSCAFPNLVWMPLIPDWRSRPPLAIARFVEAHYHAVEKVGNRLLLVPEMPRPVQAERLSKGGLSKR
jgi:hypothetical protein